MARSGRGNIPRTPSYPSYTPPVPTTNVPDTYDSYNAERNKSSKPMAIRGKGMQLGKKTKTGSAFDQIKSELGPEAEMSAPLVPSAPSAPAAAAPSVARSSINLDREAVHVTIAEAISAKFSREGSLETFEVKGDLQLRISDPSLTQIKLSLDVGNSRGAQLTSHPKVDKNVFKNSKVIQLADTSKGGFPVNNSIGVMRWKLSPKSGEIDDPPITFTVWVNDAGSNTWNITVEYEWTGGDALRDVTVTIPYQTSEPAVSSFDAVYEVSGDSIDWTIGAVDDENATGSFEFEAQADNDNEFFPMSVRFSKTKPFIDVDVSTYPAQAPRGMLMNVTGILGIARQGRSGYLLLQRYQVCCRLVCYRLRVMNLVLIASMAQYVRVRDPHKQCRWPIDRSADRKANLLKT